MGMIPISSKNVYWAELILIQILVPNTSFLGHLCGIVSGILYIHGFLEPLFSPLALIPDMPQDETVHHQPPTNYTYTTYNPRATNNPWTNDNRYDAGIRRRVVRDGVLY